MKTASFGERNNLSPSFTLSLMYLIFSLVWITLTTPLTASVVKDTRQFEWIELVKGVLFVMVTTFLFFAVSSKYVKRLTAEKRRFARLVEAIPDMLFLIDRDGKFLDYASNHDGELLTPPSQFLGKTVDDTLPPEVAEIVREKVQSALEKHATQQMTYSLVIRGKKKHYDARLAPATENEIIVVVRDVTESVEREQRLKDQEVLLTEMGRIAKIGGWKFNTKTMEGKWTDEVAHIHDLDPSLEPSVALGLSFFQGEHRAKIEQAVKAAVEEGTPYDLELEMISAKGAHKWVRTIAHPIRKGDEVVVVWGTFQDITDRHRSEQALRESYQFTKRVLETLPAHIAVLSPNGVVLSVNKAWQEFIDSKQVSVLESAKVGSNYFQTCAQAAEQGYELASTILSGLRAVQSGKLERFRHEYASDVDGAIRWYDVQALPFIDNSGVIVFHSDITAQREAAERVANSERRFRALIENATDIITVISPDGTILYHSPSAERVLGYTESELVGKNAFDFIHEQDRPAVLKLIEQYLAQEGVIVETEYRFLHKDGRWRMLGSIGKNMIGDSTLRGIVVNSRDVTEKNLYEQELIAMREQALHMNKLKDEFIANISHEIRTPLNVMFGYLSLVSDMDAQPGAAELDEYYSIIRRSGERLMRTVDHILNISLLSSGALEVHRQSVNVLTKVEEIEKDFRMTASEKSLTLDIEIFSERPMIFADPYCLEQALVNLMENAIKYTDAGGVTIKVYEESGSVKISIRDTGIGISDEYMPRLYEEFSQEVTGYTRPYEGVGLGMALVKRYVQLNNGHIEVYSKKGEGTEFVLAFPVADG